MNTYRRLANAVFLFHWFWIALLLGGVFIQTTFEWYKPIQMIVVTSSVAAQIIWLGCPLVALENALRAKYNPDERYYGSFVCYYLRRWLGVKVPPILITATLVIIVATSAFVWLR